MDEGFSLAPVRYGIYCAVKYNDVTVPSCKDFAPCQYASTQQPFFWNALVGPPPAKFRPLAAWHMSKHMSSKECEDAHRPPVLFFHGSSILSVSSWLGCRNPETAQRIAHACTARDMPPVAVQPPDTSICLVTAHVRCPYRVFTGRRSAEVPTMAWKPLSTQRRVAVGRFKRPSVLLGG